MTDNYDYEDDSFWEWIFLRENQNLRGIEFNPKQTKRICKLLLWTKIIGVYEKSNDSWVAGCKSCQIFLFEDTKEALRKKWNSIRGVPQS